MKPFVTYEVIDEFDRTKNHGIKIYPRYQNCMSLFKKGQKLTTQSFLKEYEKFFGPIGYQTRKQLIYKSIGFAKKLGLVMVISSNEHILLQDFAKQESVAYLLEQLRRTKRRNIKRGNLDSTSRTYLYLLWDFHKWLQGQNFEYSNLIPTSESTFERSKKTIQLEGLEHLLNLYKESYNSQSDFIRIIKKYLISSHHKGKKAGSVGLPSCNIGIF